MWQWLAEPLEFAFMRQALGVGVLVGILCAVMGSYLIVQQMAMLGGAISHSVVPGLSLAYFFGWNLAVGAFVAGVLSALAIAAIETRSRLKVDAAMALILTTFLASGMMLISLLRTNQIDLNQILFGDILSVRPADVVQTLAITGVILVLVKLFYKELLFYSFDPLGARASGLPVNVLYFSLICGLTLAIVATMQTVGVLLAIALLVGPAMTAYLLVSELHQMMTLGAVIGSLASVSGMYVSYYLDVPSGPAIALAAFCAFALAFCFSPRQGLLTAAYRQARQSKR
ncbi:MAG: metal ABC transporter permease [Spirulinaceae cyanobacterium SM2_1_0]|nr:metal ABC transporter permease [Spirulinaceae cyanobacterium SM2_1_0]